MNLLHKTADELRQMSKAEVHEGYKKIISRMLFEFYIDASLADGLQTVDNLELFIENWITLNIKPPQQDWNPGDSGK